MVETSFVNCLWWFQWQASSRQEGAYKMKRTAVWWKLVKEEDKGESVTIANVDEESPLYTWDGNPNVRHFTKCMTFTNAYNGNCHSRLKQILTCTMVTNMYNNNRHIHHLNRHTHDFNQSPEKLPKKLGRLKHMTKKALREKFSCKKLCIEPL